MAAGNTYVAIAEQTLGTAAASVTFSSIPSTYTDLVLVINGGTTAGTGQVASTTINNDTATNYSRTDINGDGTSIGSSTQSLSAIRDNAIGINGSIGDYNQILNFMNYSNATTYKTVLQRINRASASNFPGACAAVYLWRSTSAINRIDVGLSASTWLAGSTFSLYGILAA